MLFKYYINLLDVMREIIIVFLGMLLFSTTTHAAGTQNIDSCYANYFAEKGELVIPCVDFIEPSGIVESYEVILKQLSTADGLLQFGLKEWQASPNQDAIIIQEDAKCRAIYSVEQGNLLIPCVNVIDSSGLLGVYEIVMNQLNSNLVEIFKFEVTESNKIGINVDTRSTRDGLFGGTINLVVSGAGKVTSSAGSCSGNQKNCSWKFSSLLTTLTAVPDSGKQFTGWGGACSGKVTWCMIPLVKETKSVTATFTSSISNLSTTGLKFGGVINLTVSGGGKITSSMGTCSGSQKKCSWPSSSLMTKLTAIPDNGKQFTGWGGEGCSGTITSCTVFLAKETKSVTATFTSTTTQKPATTPPVTPSQTPSQTTQLVITISGADGSNAQVVGNKSNINCANSCTYKITSPVILSLKSFKFANGGNKYEIDTWDGSACRGNTTSCTIVPTGQNQTVYVNLKVYLARMELNQKNLFDNPLPPNGWIIETLGSTMKENKGTIGANWPIDILYNVIKPEIGTIIHVTVRSNFIQNVVGWNKSNMTAGCEWIDNRVCSYDLTKVSN